MTHASAKSSFINNSVRCSHYFANGRRCRLYTTSLNSTFCPGHAPREPQADPAEVAVILTANLDDLSSPEQINTFLSRLLLLLAQDKISARRAAVLTYIASQLLRSVHTMILEEKHKPMELIFDAPRPGRSKLDPRDAANAADSAATSNKEKVPA
jgi:hypothetical protein